MFPLFDFWFILNIITQLNWLVIDLVMFWCVFFESLSLIVFLFPLQSWWPTVVVVVLQGGGDPWVCAFYLTPRLKIYLCAPYVCCEWGVLFSLDVTSFDPSSSPYASACIPVSVGLCYYHILRLINYVDLLSINFVRWLLILVSCLPGWTNLSASDNWVIDL